MKPTASFHVLNSKIGGEGGIKVSFLKKMFKKPHKISDNLFKTLQAGGVKGNHMDIWGRLIGNFTLPRYNVSFQKVTSRRASLNRAHA